MPGTMSRSCWRRRRRRGGLRPQGGPPLGSVDGFPYPVEQRQLAPGELLLLYTDGVTDAENPENSFYTMARLERLLASAPVDRRQGGGRFRARRRAPVHRGRRAGRRYHAARRALAGPARRELISAP